MTNEIRSIIKLILASVIAAFAVAGVIFALTYESKIEEAKMNGYNKAIEIIAKKMGGEYAKYATPNKKS